MAYTDIGSSAGVIFDVNENARLNDFANQFNTATEQMDKEEAKKKDFKRYIIIGISAVVILVLLKLAVKNR
jgi:flagellar biosynthesis/type III secretory pathway M-ring protein FliF/YscJ